MRKVQIIRRCLLASVLYGITPGYPPSLFPGEQKMKPAELIARHLQSIGTAEARSALRNRVLDAKADVIFRLGPSKGHLGGTGSVISQAPMIRFAMTFGREDYPGEQLVFDGRKVSEALLRPHVRSDLTKIVHEYDFLLKEGLLGGTMSMAWCLFDAGERQAKLDYRGLKKIEGKQFHELKIQPKNSGNWNVFFYFEPETFRHVRSLYELKVQPFLAGNIDESARNPDSYWRLREEFGDFRTIDGLSLPHSYKLVLTYDSQNRPFITEWDFTTTQIRHNQELDSATFTIR